MLNKVVLMGRLGKDPEMRRLQSGAAMTTFTLATDESWLDRNGQRVEHTEWHRVVTFQRQAENCAQHLFRGSLVYVEGSIQTRKWQDQQGQTRYVTEVKAQRVIFLDRRRPAGEQQPGADDGWGGQTWQPDGQSWQNDRQGAYAQRPARQNQGGMEVPEAGPGQIEEAPLSE